MTQIDEKTGVFSLSAEEIRIQQEQDRLAVANPNANINSLSQAGGTPPTVTGLGLVTNVGTIHVRWNSSDISDLKFYEVQISENAVFTTGVITRYTRETEYRWSEGTGGTTYYVRVRVHNTSSNFGPWSSRVNTTTGKVSTSDIDVGAASEIHTFTYGDDAGETFTLLNATGNNEAYGPLVVDVFDNNSVVEPIVFFEFDYSCNWGAGDTANYYTINLERRAQGATSWTVVNSARIDMKSTVPTFGGGTARTTSPSFSNYDQPGSGVWEYQIKITLTITGTTAALTFQGQLLEMEFTQSKR
jgi:hypothetical protein